jgi:predicted permease
MFTAAAAAVACLLAGAAPVLHGLRTDVRHALKAGSRELTGSRSALRRTLLVTQTALSVVLLVGSGLFVRSLSRVRAVDVGIDLDRVLVVDLSLARAGFDTARQRVLADAALERLRQVPGVAGATVVAATTPSRVGISLHAAVPGAQSDRAPPEGGPYYSVIDGSFLQVLGTRVLRGRGFLPAELRGTSRVALVNQATADFYWPGENPLGKCLLLGRERVCTEVVGVVQSVLLFRVVNGPRYAQLFLPPTHPAAGRRERTLFVRAAGDPAVVAQHARDALQRLAPDMPYVRVRSFAEIVAPELRPWRLGATMFSVFGLVALAIAAIGLYGVMAYWVSQRTFEFGVRTALGARRSDLQREVVGESVRMLVPGLAIGLGVAAAIAPRAAELLFQTSPHAPAVYAQVGALLAVAALAAAIVPTRAATRVDPATALRQE